MPITNCLHEFSTRLRKLPSSSWRREVEKLPDSCLFGCTPGGCRKHCSEYVEAALYKADHAPKQVKPPKSKPKGAP